MNFHVIGLPIPTQESQTMKRYSKEDHWIKTALLFIGVRGAIIIYAGMLWFELCILSVVLILWLYKTYCIIHFSYTILQTIYFCFNLGYFGH